MEFLCGGQMKKNYGEETGLNACRGYVGQQQHHPLMF